MFQNVADESLSAGDSASFIIAQMKAFGIEADNAIHIVDAVNAVSNNFAVSSGDLAQMYYCLLQVRQTYCQGL